MLPEKKSMIKRELWEYHWLIYGQPKVGKTSFVSQFNDPLFICTEDRHKHLNIYKVPAQGCIKSWIEFLQILAEINKSIEENKFKWKTIVIDTLDNCFKYCTDYILQKYNLTHESEMEWGKGYAYIRNEFFRVINKLCSLGIAVVFISHSDEKAIKTRTVEIIKTVVSIPATCRKVILPIIDIIGYIGFDQKEENKRLLYLQGNEALEAGCATHVTMPAVIDLDYKKLEQAFKK